MEKDKSRKYDEGVYLPESSLEARNIAAAKLSEAEMLIFNDDRKSQREARKLRMDAERLELHAFNLAIDNQDFEMMGVGVASAMEIRMLIGDFEGAKGLGMVGLNAIGDRSPEFKDRILENLDKIKNRQKRV